VSGQHVEIGTLGVICKLDLEKAYNHDNWSSFSIFLGVLALLLMEELDVYLYLRGLILYLTNGSPQGFFGSSLGLCQGNPLLQLFVFVMEAFSRLPSRAMVWVFI
jgi:hypothetical protein